MKEEVKSLWKECFHDNKEFIDLYFSRKYCDDLNKAITRNGQIVSALQMLPYSMTFYGEIIPLSYISGACTHPAYRNQGTMKELLKETHCEMYRQGKWISALIPAEEWLFDYYARSGYVDTFKRTVKHIKVQETHFSNEYENKIETYRLFQPEIYTYFNRKMLERPCGIQHSAEDFKTIVADLHISKGNLYISCRNGLINGMIFCLPKKSVLHVTETLTDNKEIMNELFDYASQQTKTCQIKAILPPKNKNARRLGMLRIINAQKILGLYAKCHPMSTLNLHITDPHIPQNDGYYYVCKGKLTYLPYQKDGQPILETPVSDLPSLLFNEKYSPYMSLMLN